MSVYHTEIKKNRKSQSCVLLSTTQSSHSHVLTSWDTAEKVMGHPEKIWDIWDSDITTMVHEIASETCKMYYTASSQAFQRPFYASKCHALST